MDTPRQQATFPENNRELMQNLGIEEDEMQDFLDAFCDSDIEWSDSEGTSSEIPKSRKITCIDCGTSFGRFDNYQSHRRIHEKPDVLEEYACSICKKVFARKDNIKRHLLTHKKSTSTVNEGASSSTAVVNTERPTCETCQKSFGRKAELNRHLKIHTGEKPFACAECGKAFPRKDKLDEHVLTHQRQRIFHNCDECEVQFTNKKDLLGHKKSAHSHSRKRKLPVANAPSSKRVRKHDVQALNGTFVVKIFEANSNNEGDFLIFFEENHRTIAEEIQYRLQEMGALKWNMVAHVNMRRVAQDGEEEVVTAYFKTNFVIEMTDSTISNHIYDGNAKILQSFDKYVQLGSGWTLDKILKLELCMAKNHPLASSSFIPTPKKLHNKSAIVNIQNLDQKCLIKS